MSTPCKIEISDLYTAKTVLAEIAWLEKEMDKVKEKMIRKPSKIKHLRDLERQKNDKLQILERSYK